MPRPLLVTADPSALDELLRLVALAGVEADVVHDLGEVRRHWEAAPLVVVGEDLLDELVVHRLARRDGVLVLGRDLDDAGVWQRAVDLGAQRVVFLPDAERWLVEALADAGEGGAGRGRLVCVVGGRGGAGATTLACSLARTAARQGIGTLLVDGDPLGGGVDVVFRAEEHAGLRWPELAGARGRIPAAAFARGLLRVEGLALLSWDRGEGVQVPVEAARAVLSAATRAHELVVMDVPRHVDEVGREALLAAETTVLIVPAEVRAAAAAARVAARLGALCRDVRLVVRGPSPAGLTAQEIEQALGVPLLGDVRAEPHVARLLEEGTLAAARRGSPLGGLCQEVLDALVTPARRAA